MKHPNAVFELMDAVDSYIPLPQSETEKPFLMPVEDIFSISGRGTVVTGRIERGTVKMEEEIEIVGISPTVARVVTGIEMFNKLLDSGQAGDNVGFFFAVQNVRKWNAVRFWLRKVQSRLTKNIKCSSLHLDERRRWTSYSFRKGLSSTVLLPYNGCYRCCDSAGRCRNCNAGR